MNRLWIAVVLVMVAGCATTPPPANRAEWEVIHVREYAGVTPRQVQDAAEQVFRLADHDFKFQYPDGKLIASRNWMIYAVIAITGGNDHWTIETRQTDDGTRVTAMITRDASTATAAPIVGGSGVAPMVTGTPGIPITQAAPYRLFWDRMDYKMGLRSDWITCDTFKDDIKRDVRLRDRGQLDALCGVTADDMTPEQGPKES